MLVVDDASGDRTAEIGRAYRRAHLEIAMTVLRNEYNQGYGGNQKVGYAFAIREGFDFVGMIHGDGQYAPEELPALVAPLRDGRADAVFGSRMMNGFTALKGGMPLYKFVENRILTWAQNLLLGTSLTEFYSGYRVYSVAALQKISTAASSRPGNGSVSTGTEAIDYSKLRHDLPRAGARICPKRSPPTAAIWYNAALMRATQITARRRSTVRAMLRWRRLTSVSPSSGDEIIRERLK